MTATAWQALVVALTVAVVVEGVVLVGLLRQTGTLLLQLDPPRPGAGDAGGPPIAAELPPGLVPDGGPGILLFLSPTCSICPAIADAVPTFLAHYSDITLVPVIIGGAADQRAAYAARLRGSRLDLAELYDAWKVPGTPYAVATAANKVLARGVVNTLPQLETLADSALAYEEERWTALSRN